MYKIITLDTEREFFERTWDKVEKVAQYIQEAFRVEKLDADGTAIENIGVYIPIKEIIPDIPD